jgi:hypothetical protein
MGVSLRFKSFKAINKLYVNFSKEIESYQIGDKEKST